MIIPSEEAPELEHLQFRLNRLLAIVDKMGLHQSGASGFPIVKEFVRLARPTPTLIPYLELYSDQCCRLQKCLSFLLACLHGLAYCQEYELYAEMWRILSPFIDVGTPTSSWFVDEMISTLRVLMVERLPPCGEAEMERILRVLARDSYLGAHRLQHESFWLRNSDRILNPRMTEFVLWHLRRLGSTTTYFSKLLPLLDIGQGVIVETQKRNCPGATLLIQIYSLLRSKSQDSQRLIDLVLRAYCSTEPQLYLEYVPLLPALPVDTFSFLLQTAENGIRVFRGSSQDFYLSALTFFLEKATSEQLIVWLNEGSIGRLMNLVKENIIGINRLRPLTCRIVGNKNRLSKIWDLTNESIDLGFIELQELSQRSDKMGVEPQN